jgi:group I intron endonuclease
MENRDNPQLTSDSRQMGFIYIVTCDRSDKAYIGQTINPIRERWRGHRAAARLLEPRQDVGPGDREGLHEAMARLGLDAFAIEELRVVPLHELDDEEIYWIAELKTLAPEGYNLTEGGSRGFSCPHTAEARAKISASRQANIDELRNEKLAGMPVRFTYRNYEEAGEQIILLKHPLCASKCFSVKEHGSFEKAKEVALKFHSALEAGGLPYVPVVRTRRTEVLPKGMYCSSNGKGYGYSKILDGATYRKQFAKSSKTKGENKRLTFEHFNGLLREHGLPAIEMPAGESEEDELIKDAPPELDPSEHEPLEDERPERDRAKHGIYEYDLPEPPPAAAPRRGPAK